MYVLGKRQTVPAEGKYSTYLENYTIMNFTFSALLILRIKSRKRHVFCTLHVRVLRISYKIFNLNTEVKELLHAIDLIT
jgi:hypothetical protein